MIEILREFAASWHLLQTAYLGGWLIALVLALAGVVVVARDQIFIGAAVSQASTLGIAVVLLGTAWLGGAHAGEGLGHSTRLEVAASVLASVLAALATARARTLAGESHEAVTGWVFLLATSLSVLLLTHQPHGLERVQRLLASSIIGVTAGDLAGLAALLVVTAAGLALLLRPLMLYLMDPAMAAAVGLKIGRWDVGLAVWLGLAIGLPIHASGMLYTFGCLVLPALAAKNLCREVRPMFLVAPALALGSGMVAFVLAHHYDFPPAQMAVALMAYVLALAWLARRIGRALSLGAGLAVLLAAVQVHQWAPHGRHERPGGGAHGDEHPAKPAERRPSLDRVELELELEGLLKDADPAKASRLEHLWHATEDEALRLRIARGLAELGKLEGIEHLVELLRTARQPATRREALAVLAPLAGADLGLKPDAPSPAGIARWEAWWRAHRPKLRWDERARRFTVAR